MVEKEVQDSRSDVECNEEVEASEQDTVSFVYSVKCDSSNLRPPSLGRIENECFGHSCSETAGWKAPEINPSIDHEAIFHGDQLV